MTSSAHSKSALVLDVGTTNIKVFVYNEDLKEIFSQEQVIATSHPRKDWAEQNPNEILDICLRLIRVALPHCDEHTCLGITNQRESVMTWDKETGTALSQLILWSDKRTETYCDHLRATGVEATIRQKTGLFLTAYSSAPKLRWLLDQEDVKCCGSLAIGTLDSWLVYKLTGNHITDYTNASRTMLFNIQSLRWDDRLLEIFGIPLTALAKVKSSQSEFGAINSNGIPPLLIRAVVGDQQASMYAAGTKPGTIKVTYGTGIFPMKLIGEDYVLKNDYLTTLAIGNEKQPIYAFEGKVEDAARRVSEVIDSDKPAFDALMLHLAHEAAPIISGLVERDTATVYVDGGISQNSDILAEQEKLNHVKVQRLASHNGSALGVARLLMSRF